MSICFHIKVTTFPQKSPGKFDAPQDVASSLFTDTLLNTTPDVRTPLGNPSSTNEDPEANREMMPSA